MNKEIFSTQSLIKNVLTLGVMMGLYLIHPTLALLVPAAIILYYSI